MHTRSLAQARRLGTFCTLALALAAPAAAQVVQTQKFLSPTFAEFDVFGCSIDIEGDLAVIGAANDDTVAATEAGSVFVYRRVNGVWTLEAQINAPTPARFASFGATVSLSGNTLVVGAPNDPVNGFPGGAVYVFRRSAAGAWLLEARLRPSFRSGNTFATHVAFDGDIIAASSPGDDGALGERVGSVWVFRRTGTSWSQDGRIADPAQPEYGEWPDSLDVRDGRIAIGSMGDQTPRGFTGSVQVFEHDGAGWTRTARVFAADGTPGDWFGASVRLLANGMIAGAIGEDYTGATDAGAAYVFTRAGNVWTQQGKLTPAAPASHDWFGDAVGGDGAIAVVGAKTDDTPQGVDAGSATVFAHRAGVWTREATLTAPDGARDDWFGSTIAVSGQRLLVGAFADDQGSAFQCGSVYAYQSPLFAEILSPPRRDTSVRRATSGPTQPNTP